jgi:hypothetical protein
MLILVKNGYCSICKLLILIGLITQLLHNLLDIIGLKHFFHDQLEVEIFLTLSVILSIWNAITQIEITQKYRKYFQVVLLIGTFSNLIISVILTIAEMFEILEEHEFGFIQGLITFLLVNSIFSLIYLLLKYKRDFGNISWNRIFYYEGMFILIALILNFLIEPILHLLDFIGYDIFIFISFLTTFVVLNKEKILKYWKKQKMLVISLSTVSFILLWQFGLLGF